MIDPLIEKNLSRLLEKYSSGLSTDRLISFLADHYGILEACELIVESSQSVDPEIRTWLEQKCSSRDINSRYFLKEIQHILGILRPGYAPDDSYTVLGLEPGASETQIKGAYRRLSKKYHPDTSSGNNEEHSNTFIRIHRAYHNLIGEENNTTPSSQDVKTPHWRQSKRRRVKPKVSRKSIVIVGFTATLLIIFSIVASINYRNRMMISGLRSSANSFSPTGEENNLSEIQNNSSETSSDLRADQDDVAPLDGDRTPNDSHKKDQTAITTPSAPSSNPDNNDPTSDSSKSLIDLYTENKRPIPISKKVEIARSSEEQVLLSAEISEDTESLDEEYVKSDQIIYQYTVSDNDISINEASEWKDNEGENISEKRKNQNLNTDINVLEVEEKNETDLLSENNDIPVINEITRESLDDFITKYIEAYEQKNLLLFTRFFTVKATENGKQLADTLTDYMDLFAKTRSINLDIEILDWSVGNPTITMTGQFGIQLDYLDSRIFEGNGTIDFVLTRRNNNLLISNLIYEFD